MHLKTFAFCIACERLYMTLRKTQQDDIVKLSSFTIKKEEKNHEKINFIRNDY